MGLARSFLRGRNEKKRALAAAFSLPNEDVQ
jgi:hypothetical protein